MTSVLFLIHDLCEGGAEKVLVNLVNNMDLSKFDITVMTIFDVGINKQFLHKSIHYKYIYKRMIRGNSHLMKLLTPKQLHKKYIKDHYDIEIAYLEGPCARIISGCTDSLSKRVSWIHREQFSTKIAKRSFRNKYEAAACYNRFNAIVAVSETVKNDFKKCLKINTRMQVLYNTNETDKILELSKDLVTDVELKDAEIKLVGVGKLIKSKGFDRIVRITERLIEEGYPVHLYLLGIGPEKENLESYIHKNGISNSVTLLGYQTNPYKYVVKCDLFVCASYAEGFSTAATEALIVGTPVCTVNVSGMKEMLGNHDEYGIVTENNDEELYKAIRKLIADEKLLNYYKKMAQIRGKSFNTKSTVTAVEEFLLTL